MFYDNFKYLCDQRGERPYTVVKSLGAKSAHAIEQWKRGSIPRQPMLEKIAAYFDVPIDFLLTGKENSPEAEASRLSENEEMIFKLLRTRKDRDAAGASVIAFLQALPNLDENE